MNNALWLTGVGCLYFRATLTGERNQKIFEATGNRDGGESALALEEKLGPVRFRDPRIFALACVLSLSAWVGPYCGTNLRWVLTLVSIGAFISPLTLPAPPLTLHDLRSPFAYLFKWIFVKLDGYFKHFLFGGICFVLFKIPWIGRLEHRYAQNAFGIVEGSASKLFEEVLGAGAAVLMLMIMLRLTQIFANGLLLAVIWLSSISFLWVSLQYEASEILNVKAPLLTGFVLLLATTGIDFFNDILEVFIDAMEPSEDPGRRDPSLRR
jgi:hypothetical protein